jgi:hypothetical protein
MKRLAWLVGSFGMVAWGLGGTLAACGGEADVAVAPPDAAAEGSVAAPSSSSSGAAEAGASSSGGASGGLTDGGPMSEGGADGGASSGATSNPGKVSCGAAECTSPTQACCAGVLLDGGPRNTCQPAGDGCFGVKQECDEKADCNGAQICCTDFGGGLSFECKAGCAGQNVQICKTSAECGDAGACKEYSCPGGRKIRSCTKPGICD